MFESVVEILVKEMVLMFGEDGSALLMEGADADDGAITEVLIVFLERAMDNVVVGLPCEPEMFPEEADKR